LLFTHYEAVRPHVSYEEAIRVTVWRHKDVVAVSVDKRRELMVEVDIGLPLMKLADAEVLEPALRALHAIELPIRAIRMLHDGGLSAGNAEISDDEGPAIKQTGECSEHERDGEVGADLVIIRIKCRDACVAALANHSDISVSVYAFGPFTPHPESRVSVPKDPYTGRKSILAVHAITT
jgi:hypothetical protein